MSVQTWQIDRRVTLAVILAIAAQMAAALVWAGAAAQRLDALERAQRVARTEPERLARLEARLDHITRQLDRIEARLERAP